MIWSCASSGAECAKKYSRKSDISCRYGGDEFVLILPDTLLADTQKRVEQVCTRVKQLPSLHNSAPLCDEFPRRLA